MTIRFPQLSALFAAAVLAGSSGCASAAKDSSPKQPKPPAPAAFSEKDGAAARDAAGVFVGAFADALKAGEWDRLPPELRPKVSEAMFRRMCDSFGKRRGTLVGTGFVTVLDQGIVRDYLWKFTFEKPLPAPAGSAPDAAPATQKNEVIYLVRMGILEGKPTIVGCGFQQ